MIVGFQGEQGAFSDEAVAAAFGHVPTRGYRTFEDLLSAVDEQAVTHGLLPCENSIAGSIARAYDLLSQYESIRIAGETKHRIEQCLIGLPGARIETLERVASHPVAIEQCRRFLAAHPYLRVDLADDTAGSVRAMVERGNLHVAAIGPALAAERYGGVVLKRGVQDDEENYTRFFLITRGGEPAKPATRTCFVLHLPHRAGSLHEALGVLARRGLNLRSLVARPNRQSPFEYVFYVEIDAPETTDAAELLAAFEGRARLLGRY
ncbi:MAG TPA: prephenate dehydratase domain-containing protein [Candidatus Baltobacteraceae bacterium]|nr:prephenate dehydratase domain-containing protein [Candidatus Baltobacteraceae bacterium]